MPSLLYIKIIPGSTALMAALWLDPNWWIVYCTRQKQREATSAAVDMWLFVQERIEYSMNGLSLTATRGGEILSLRETFGIFSVPIDFHMVCVVSLWGSDHYAQTTITELWQLVSMANSIIIQLLLLVSMLYSVLFSNLLPWSSSAANPDSWPVSAAEQIP